MPCFHSLKGSSSTSQVARTTWSLLEKIGEKVSLPLDSVLVYCSSVLLLCPDHLSVDYTNAASSYRNMMRPHTEGVRVDYCLFFVFFTLPFFSVTPESSLSRVFAVYCTAVVTWLARILQGARHAIVYIPDPPFIARVSFELTCTRTVVVLSLSCFHGTMVRAPA